MTVNRLAIPLVWCALGSAPRARSAACAAIVHTKVIASAHRAFSIPSAAHEPRVERNRRVVVQKTNELIDCGNLWWVRHTYPQGPFERKDFWSNYICQEDLEALKQLKDANVSFENMYSNHFIRWVRNSKESDLPNLSDPSKPLCMNCVDFVYLVLHQADLIRKSRINSIYQREFHVSARHRQESDLNYYGFNLAKTKPLHEAKPGNLLIVKYCGKPIHVGVYLGGSFIGHMWGPQVETDEYGNMVHRPMFRASRMHIPDLLQMYSQGFYRPLSISAVDLESIEDID